MRTIVIWSSLLFILVLCATDAQSSVYVEPFGFAISAGEEPVEAELVITNSGDEEVTFNLRNQSVRRDNRLGPRRDDPGDVIQEFELRYHYCLGLDWDGENSIMWAVHTLSGRIVGYQWDGEEITDIVADFPSNPENIQTVGLAYHEGIVYTIPWTAAASPIYRFSTEGEFLGSVQTQIPYLMGIAIDRERGIMLAWGDFNASNSIWVLDINDNFNTLAQMQNVLGRQGQDARGRLTWVPEHDEGHLWLSLEFRNWQLSVDEEWNLELIQDFASPSDVRSFGIAHDGVNLWNSTGGADGFDENGNQIWNPDLRMCYLVDDGISEIRWLTYEPKDGVIEGNGEAVINLTFNPEGLEAGTYEQLLKINTDNPDIDRIDIAILFTVNEEFGTLGGRVARLDNNEPIENAEVYFVHYRIVRHTNEDGMFHFGDLPLGEYLVVVTAPDFHWQELDVVIDQAGEIDLDVRLSHSTFTPNVDAFITQTEPDNRIVLDFSARNNGNGILTYSTEKKLPGEADRDPWELRRSYPISEIVQDERVQGAFFFNDHFYVAGSAARQKLVYVLNREGEEVRRFNQFAESTYGYTDLDYDGELIWGTGERRVFGFTSEGELVASWDGPFATNNNLAWDSDRGVLWVGGNTTNIFAYDREGNRGQELNRRGLRMYGLAYYPEDPDEYPLYILHNPVDDVQAITKMNPDNNDTMSVGILNPDGGGRPASAFISNQLDIYSWVFITVSNPGPEDRIDIWQLAGQTDWFMVEPDFGAIEAGETQDFELVLDATDLPLAEFEAEVIFHHNGVGGETTLPITMNVVEGRVRTFRTLNFTAGWNMVSVNIEPDETDVPELTAPLVEEDLLIMVKDGAGRFYRPEFGFNNIPFWNYAQGYQVRVTEACQLRVDGISILPDTPIDLGRGWQLIAYYPRAAVDAVVAFSGIQDNLEIAKDVAGRFYLPAWEFSNMGMLREGQGYQVKMTEADELIWSLRPAVASLRWHQTLLPNRDIPKVEPTNVNMSVLVLSELDGIVLVYAGERLVGSGQIIDGAAGIAVWGDDTNTPEIEGALADQPLTMVLRTAEGDLTMQTEDLSGVGKYYTDGLWVVKLAGAVEIPLEFGIVGAYPNPFNSSMRLSYSLPEIVKVEIGLFDVNGRMVKDISLGEQSVGTHSLTIDGTSLSSGVYVLQLLAGDNSARMKVTLIK